jgi:HD-GYP domain-containing protein (c-di-GMP phosphodiesterase class II)
VQQALHFTFEFWDGSGPFGVHGSAIPLCSRIVLAAFVTEPFLRLKGPAAAEQAASAFRGKSFDPQVADTFRSVLYQGGFVEGLQKEEMWDDVLSMEPDSPIRHAPDTRLDDVALAFADFIDLKALTTQGHSRETARWAECIARGLGLPQADVTAIRRAALVHDLGNVAVPALILDKPGRLTAAEQERLRLHPYYTERILARAPALQKVALIAGAHHERLDGQGYFRGLAGAQIPIAARVLAVADVFQEHCAGRPDQPGLSPEDALRAMRPEVGPSLDPDCFAALGQELGVTAPQATAPQATAQRVLPAGLTEREVEVLRLVAKGASNRQIAKTLSISEKTAGHHLEHIYDKIGVSGRGAAVFFAMEHELIA